MGYKTVKLRVFKEKVFSGTYELRDDKKSPMSLELVNMIISTGIVVLFAWIVAGIEILRPDLSQLRFRRLIIPS